MSDTDKNEQELSSINDELKTISISDDKPLIVEDVTKTTESIKTVEDESYDENDSEYEDIEDDEINNTSELTSIINLKTKTDDVDDNDEIRINIKPRRLNKKHGDDNDEQSEGHDDDNQNVPKVNKTKKVLDDDNNTSSPAYIPRKGKYYEHDDRTLDENIRSQQEKSRNKNRFHSNSDGKWQHDLYFQDQQISKSRNLLPKQNNYSQRFEHRQEQFHLNDYIPRPTKVRYDYQQQIPNKSYDNNNNNTTIRQELQVKPRIQRRNYDPYQIDERTFHRRRNFTNSQYQQQENLSQLNKNQQQDNRNCKPYEFNRTENKTHLPPRFQINKNHFQKENNERSKRYSNMRNNMIPSFQQQSIQNQHSNNIEQNDWPQAPPPPTSYLPQQIITPQMFYKQQQQQTSRYVPLNYSQTSMSEQV